MTKHEHEHGFPTPTSASALTKTKTEPSLAYRNFIETCKSPATRNVYAKALSYFMGYLRLPLQAYDKLLDKDPKLIVQPPKK